MVKGSKKRFCKYGHDTLLPNGRNKKGQCAECRTKRRRINPTKDSRFKQFCVNGHDTFIVGREPWSGVCNICCKAKEKRWRDKNKVKLLLKLKKWLKEHPESSRKYKIMYQTNRQLRVVVWTDWDSINEFERNKPKGMTTDHIIPLLGKLISGLHVSWNLQYMPKSVNSCKHNKCNLLEASEWYGKILEKAGLKITKV